MKLGPESLPKGPGRCPRFNACSAPICPLDPSWSKAEHLDGERLCAYLTEAAKEGGLEMVRQTLSSEPAAYVFEEGPKIAAFWPDIRRRLKRAAGSCSRIAAAQHMRAKKGVRTRETSRPAGVVSATSSDIGVQPPTGGIRAIPGGERG